MGPQFAHLDHHGRDRGGRGNREQKLSKSFCRQGRETAQKMPCACDRTICACVTKKATLLLGDEVGVADCARMVVDLILKTQVGGGADEQQAVLLIHNTDDERGNHVSCVIDLSLRMRGIRKTSACRMQV